MSEHDWALNRAKQLILEYFSVPEGVDAKPELLIQDIAQALKQEREIATLEMEAKYKKIQWPTDEEIDKQYGLINNLAEKYFGHTEKCKCFLQGVSWVKSYVEEERK